MKRTLTSNVKSVNAKSMAANATKATASRRDFLRAGVVAGGGLLLGVRIPRLNAPSEPGNADIRSLGAGAAGNSAAPFEPNAWVRVAGDGIVTVTIAKSEMGQGVATALPMLVAEELEADWSKVRVEFAPAEARYADAGSGFQMTGGSSSVSTSWEPLRKAGAAAREMLVAAAAAQWGVDAASCRASLGVVSHTSGKSATFGELAGGAAAMPVPQDPKLKDPKDFRIIGKRTPRLDNAEKLTGRATFGIDAHVPGALTAVVVRSPVWGGSVAKFDDMAAKGIKGVRNVVQVSSGIAIVADGYWPATQARRALVVSWSEGANATRSSASIGAQMREAAKKGGLKVVDAGKPKEQMTAAAKRIEAEYEAPFIAHAMMEPGNCLADVKAGSCEVWAPTQWQSNARQTAAKASGLPENAIKIHTTFLGGGFGRKLEMDFIADAVEISKKVGAPVKVIYSREDDIQHDFYRTAAYSKIAAGLDADGYPVAWTNTVVSDSSLKRMLPMFVGPDGMDPDAVEGAAQIPYDVPNMHVEFVPVDLGVPVGAWRSVGGSQNAFVRECFVDELAAATKKDPIAYRKKLLKDPRHIGVLDLAAEKSGWGKRLPAGHFHGVALHQTFGTYVAQVAEVSVEKGVVKVHRVTCAVDCGTVVNPSGLEAQISGGIVFGLTATLKGAITIDRGRVQQSNFNDYPMLRLRDVPPIDVFVVPSSAPPTGAGEPGVPPIAPAVANAVRAATGVPVRSMPIRLTTPATVGAGGAREE